jgi:hypothetical protein
MYATDTAIATRLTLPSLTRLRGLAVLHWPLVVLISVGALVRIGCEIAYHPALFWDDSWEYLGLALHHSFVAFQVDRPSGYPLLVRILTFDGAHLIVLTVAQHVAGLATAVIVYAIGLRMRLGRWLSTAVALLVALGGDWIALEQFVMTEPFFSLCVAAAALTALDARGSRVMLAASGALIAAATLMRTGGVFLIPPWALFLFVRRVGWRSAVAGAAALVTPLLLYGALHAADGRGFGLTQTSGWFLYARVAPIARCTADWPTSPELRRICPTAAEQAENLSPGDYLWDATSPANRAYVSMYTGNVAHTSAVLKTFALQALARRPGAYVSMVGSALLSAFNPTARGWESNVMFPAPGSSDWVDPDVKREYLNDYRRRTDAPQSELRSYWTVLHTPRLLLGILTGASLVSLGLAALSRRWRAVSMPAETLLVSGMGFLLLLGTVATSDVNMRYLLPCSPLLALGGACALKALVLTAGRAAGVRSRRVAWRHGG